MRSVVRFHRCAGTVLFSGDRLLLLRKRGRDEWVLPKGHVQPRESEADAAVRESREETGLAVVLGPLLGATEYEFGSARRNRKHVTWFLGEVATLEFTLEPIFDEAAFLDPDDALARITHEDDRSIASRAIAVRYGRAEDEATE